MERTGRISKLFLIILLLSMIFRVIVWRVNLHHMFLIRLKKVLKIK